MSSVNKVILIGNAGKDPEVTYLDGGTCVANLSIATSESYKNKEGEKVENTEWHRLVFWRKLAEVVEKYVKKGMKIYVEGKLKTRSYEDKEGKTRYTTEVYVNNMTMLSGSGNGDGSAKAEQQAEVASGGMPVEGLPDNGGGFDDLPF